MFNKMKRKKSIHSFMNYANVTTVPKKGSRIEPKNERGIFRVSVLRYILMRVIYNMKYPIIDSNMRDCQMGGRKKKSCKNNIFIINGLIHNVLKFNKMKPILHEANRNIERSVKIPSGLTQRQTINNCVLQGDTFGSIMASVQVDSIGKECVTEGYTY